MHLVRKAFQSTLLLTVLLIGCKSGGEFLGKWVNSTNSNDTVQIDRNGDEFLITGPDGTKIGATLKEETLTMAQPMTGVTFTYVKSSDTLLSPGVYGQVEYKHAK
ncbi:MAG TPA: hypothetical protein VF865_11710 [Acidobacteriaceae bacterium]